MGKEAVPWFLRHMEVHSCAVCCKYQIWSSRAEPLEGFTMDKASRPGSQFTSAARVLCGLDPMTYPLSVPRRLADITLPCGPVVRINWHL